MPSLIEIGEAAATEPDMVEQPTRPANDEHRLADQGGPATHELVTSEASPNAVTIGTAPSAAPDSEAMLPPVPHSGASEIESPTPVFDWEMPLDDILEAQAALTLFERALAAFVEWRLEELHGASWLVRGVPLKLREAWRERSTQNHPVRPKNDLGYAHVSELQQLIVNKGNRKAFDPYFSDWTGFERDFVPINDLRESSFHAA